MISNSRESSAHAHLRDSIAESEVFDFIGQQCPTLFVEWREASHRRCGMQLLCKLICNVRRVASHNKEDIWRSIPCTPYDVIFWRPCSIDSVAKGPSVQTHRIQKKTIFHSGEIHYNLCQAMCRACEIEKNSWRPNRSE